MLIVNKAGYKEISEYEKISDKQLEVLAKNVKFVYAFADTKYSGNLAGVLLLDIDTLICSTVMVQLVKYLNLPVISLLHKSKDENKYTIKWYTSNAELHLCGHGTFAASYYLFRYKNINENNLYFDSYSGVLKSTLSQGFIKLSLPILHTYSTTDLVHKTVEKALDLALIDVRTSDDDIIAVVDSPSIVKNFKPNFKNISKLNFRGVILTSSYLSLDNNDSKIDIASRFFSPNINIDEDQVCVSAHCKLYPYWTNKLGKNNISAIQLSKNGGILYLTENKDNDKLTISGVCRVDYKDDLNTDTRQKNNPIKVVSKGNTEYCGIQTIMQEFNLNTCPTPIPFSMAEFRVEAHAMSDPHEHLSTELWYIKSGEGEVVADGFTKKIKHGDVIYLKTNSYHQIRNNGDIAIEALAIWWTNSV